MTNLPERFWSKVEKTESCWLWIARKNEGGYGAYSVKLWPGRDGWRSRYAHRLAYEDARGPIPLGAVIDHLCRNPSCVNPDHLEAVTQQENVRRGISPNVRIALSGKCGNGHKRTRENTYIRPDGKGRNCLACEGERKAKKRSAA